MLICKKCGSECPDGNIFCEACGAELDAPVLPENIDDKGRVKNKKPKKEKAAKEKKPMKIYNTRQEEIDGYKDNKFATIVEVTTAQIGNQSWTNMGQMFDVRSTETALIPPKKSDYLTTIEYEQEVNKFLEQLYNDNSQKRLIEEGEKKAELQKKLEEALGLKKFEFSFEHDGTSVAHIGNKYW